MYIGVSRQKISLLKGVTHEKKLKKTCMHKQPVDKHWPNLLNAGMAMTTTETRKKFTMQLRKTVSLSLLTEAGSFHVSKTTGIFFGRVI